MKPAAKRSRFRSCGLLAFAVVPEVELRPVGGGLEEMPREPADLGQPLSHAVEAEHLAADLAGSLKGLPRDLAHNPKYMDGFGERK